MTFPYLVAANASHNNKTPSFYAKSEIREGFDRWQFEIQRSLVETKIDDVTDELVTFLLKAIRMMKKDIIHQDNKDRKNIYFG